MKRESLDGYSVPAEQLCKCDGHRQETLSQQTAVCQCDCIRKPDASFVLATQAVVFDHVDKRVYVLGIVNNGAHNQCKDVGGPVGFETTEKCQQWIQEVTQSIIYLAASPSAAGSRRKSINLLSNGPTTTGATSTLPHIPFLVKQRHRRQSSAGILAPFQVDVTEQDYLNAIRDSLNYIHEGESYEICLTTQFRAHIPLFPTFDSDDSTENDLTQGDPAFDLYKILRKLNPAPFSVYLSIPTVLGDIDTPSLDRSGHVGKIIILSSSPERFLKVGRRPSDEVSAENSLDISATSRTVEMKPIKGTVAVAKGCFCKEDEGCGVHEQDDDGSEHTCDGDEIDVDDIATQAVKPTSNGRPLRRDRCAEARRRENQNRVDSLSKNIKERAENLM
ncbi:Protein phosphatase PP2A regulatory subunit B, partial [Lunasporangiospora selenospora]